MPRKKMILNFVPRKDLNFYLKRKKIRFQTVIGELKRESYFLDKLTKTKISNLKTKLKINKKKVKKFPKNMKRGNSLIKTYKFLRFYK